ncbi:MAG: hypothetical protein FWC41_04190 [Firmicutes bacterium]|nr:hypothetical protein [Bacillota bacterium]
MEEKIRHLEMIQGVITRMATNSFMLKGWAVTLVAGIFVLAAKDATLVYFLIAFIPIILFWFLDSYYLQLERKYRILYKKIGKQDEPDLTFAMQPPSSCQEDKTMYLQSFLSLTECAFYGSFVILVSIAMVIISVNVL